MLDIHQPSTDTKTYFSHTLLPAYIDALHTSAKKKPFATFLAQPHSHTLDLVLPAADATDTLRAHLTDHTYVYARVWLKLADVLDDDFLDAYVRNATAALLSHGRDTHMSLRQGVLRIEMDRPTYERAGLVGVPVEDGGRKHQRNRWAVDVDLTQASMRSGKKGFERVKWAAANVLDASRSWLFSSADPSFAQDLADGRQVLARHAPTVFTLQPHTTQLPAVAVPRLHPLSALHEQDGALHEQDDALALLDWLDLTSLGSERVTTSSNVDTHLCRYDVPDLGHGVDTRDLVRMRWTGFITPLLVKHLFLALWNAGYKTRRGGADEHSHQAQDKWFSMSAHAFGGNSAWSLVQLANRETLVWEVER